MGLEYPGTFVVGEDTAPKRAASHSFWRVSTVVEGSAVPVDWKCEKPAGRSMKEKCRWGKEVLRAERTRRPA